MDDNTAVVLGLLGFFGLVAFLAYLFSRQDSMAAAAPTEVLVERIDGGYRIREVPVRLVPKRNVAYV